MISEFSQLLEVILSSPNPFDGFGPCHLDGLDDDDPDEIWWGTNWVMTPKSTLLAVTKFSKFPRILRRLMWGAIMKGCSDTSFLDTVVEIKQKTPEVDYTPVFQRTKFETAVKIHSRLPGDDSVFPKWFNADDDIDGTPDRWNDNHYLDRLIALLKEGVQVSNNVILWVLDAVRYEQCYFYESHHVYFHDDAVKLYAARPTSETIELLMVWAITRRPILKETIKFCAERGATQSGPYFNYMMDLADPEEVFYAFELNPKLLPAHFVFMTAYYLDRYDVMEKCLPLVASSDVDGLRCIRETAANDPKTSRLEWLMAHESR